MTHQQISQYILKRLERIPVKYPNGTRQYLYEQGLLISLIANMCLNDNQNFEIVKKLFDKLCDDE